MDLAAVKVASGPELTAAAAAAAENAADLVDEAELLSVSRHASRACSLAALAVEEVGKAHGLAALAGMRPNVRAQAPVGRMLGWHAFKQVTGQLVAVVQAGPCSVADSLLELPAAELTALLSGLEEPAEEADRLKRAGLYVDINAGGLSVPGQITGADLRRQLGNARDAVGATMALLDPREQACLAHPRPMSWPSLRWQLPARSPGQATRRPRAPRPT
jgi:AbiV family abortive infection protein